MPKLRQAALVARLVICLALVAACSRSDLDEPPVPLGDFALGLNIAVADKAQKVPISRKASPDDWESAMKRAVEDRFGRYRGGRLYNLGISIDGYALAPPGIPVFAAPKSVLVFTVNLWDDATQTKLNPEGERFTVFEGVSGETVIGTGLTRTKKRQMEVLSYNAAKRVEQWLLEHPEWFPRGGGVPVPLGADGVAVRGVGPLGDPAASPGAGVLRPVPRPAPLPLPPPQVPSPNPGPSLP